MPYWLDGNNLIGQPVHVAKKDQQTCKNFLALLSSYSLTRRSQFLVFFDGDDLDRTTPPRGVLVRYSAPLSSDAAILQKLHEIKAPAEIIVVTNDRALRNSCRNAGAHTMDWSQFTSKMKTTNDWSGRKHEKTEDESAQLDEWIEFFGLDRESIE
jgi:predicted RNA-binding protein with PIN domain